MHARRVLRGLFLQLWRDRHSRQTQSAESWAQELSTLRARCARPGPDSMGSRHTPNHPRPLLQEMEAARSTPGVGQTNLKQAHLFLTSTTANSEQISVNRGRKTRDTHATKFAKPQAFVRKHEAITAPLLKTGVVGEGWLTHRPR